MRFKKGELIVHTKGTIHPYKELRGVVVNDGIFSDAGGEVYRVFWYTSGRYQNIQESCLNPLTTP